MAAIVARAKMEDLLPDADLGLKLSPAGALTNNLDGCFDFVDRRGQSMGAGATPPPGTNYLRRWSVARAADADTLIVQVQVTDIINASSAGAGAFLGGRGDYVRVAAAKFRKAL